MKKITATARVDRGLSTTSRPPEPARYYLDRTAFFVSMAMLRTKAIFFVFALTLVLPCRERIDAPHRDSEMEPTPFEMMGGTEAVRALVERFYDAMERYEPTLARFHPVDAGGHVERGSRDRFALFLIGWLGGPQDYVQQHGHPRLRMRHGRVPVDTAMRDAWLRSMKIALDEGDIQGPLRVFLDQRFFEVADFMCNTSG